MKKSIRTLFVATLVMTTAANAQAPQQELYAYLIQQAGKSSECPKVPSTSRYYSHCNPKPVSGAAKETATALQYMRNVEMLGILCSGGDSNACLRQGAFRDAVGKLGWCAAPTMGRRGESVTIWGRCGKVIVLNRAN